MAERDEKPNDGTIAGLVVALAAEAAEGPKRTFRYQVRELATGETSVHGFETTAGTRMPYWWLAGNFGCDCNRRMEFLRGRGEYDEEADEDEDGCPCNVGPNAYVFDWVELDGVRFIENDQPTEHAE